MITADDAATVGNVAANTFLASAGWVTIGAGTDLSDIDLTAETLDSRVRFACDSSRLYWAADGTLKTAAAGNGHWNTALARQQVARYLSRRPPTFSWRAVAQMW